MTYASYPYKGGAVPTYTNLAAFPTAASVGNGALAIALDSNILYESTGSAWEILADPAGTSSAITALTGEVTATGPGSVAATIANLAVTNAKIANATIDLTAKVTGALPLVNGGTGTAAASANAALNALSPLNAKGDVLGYSTVNARVPVGSNGNILTADSSQTLGIKWAPPATSGTVTSVDVSGGTTGLTYSGGPITGSGTITASGTLVAANGGTGVTSSSGSGSVVLNTSPSLVTPLLGTPTSGDLSNCTNVSLTSGVTGALPLVNGGTGTAAASANAAFNALSPLSTKGDLVSYSTVNARLGVGSNGNVLTADSAQTLGVKWAPPATAGTVTSVDMSVPSLLSVSGGPITSSGTLGVTYSGTALPIANGGTAVTSVTTAPATTAFAGWDANKNLSANNFIGGYATTATGAGTTTLTVASAQQQFFTGTSTQTVLLPVTSTLALGQRFLIVNNSTGVVTVQSSGANTIQAMATNSVATYTVILTSGTTAASWNLEYTAAAAVSTTLNQYNTLFGNASNVATATNTNLLGDIIGQTRSQAATVTIASPGVFTSNSHGMANGDKFYLETSGALPTGLSADTTYYASNVATNTFNASTSLANAVAGTYITTSGSQSGTHTLFMGGLTLTSGVKGVNDASSATAGYVGQFLEATGSGVTISGSATVITHLDLTPGDWDLSAHIEAQSGTSPSIVLYIGTTSSSSAGTTLGSTFISGSRDAVNGWGGVTSPMIRVNISTATTYYLNGAFGTVTTNAVTGYMNARRVR